MRKADAVAWGKLEDPKHKPEPEVTDEMNTEQEDVKPDWYISDDDISESDWEDEEEDKKESEKKEEKQADDGPPELEEPAAVPPEK
ncbi:ryanodine receptor 1-like [Sinocyclocheilus anshuiensis]|nr:PREDICTED: ryanodine receptor 1-like [Sinocyclocheilus anshuiensis]